jgi:tRNA A37 threonylcarbamoyladenosine dehydratase
LTGLADVLATVPHDVDTARRFGGLDRLYGVQGAARIRAAHVAVVGLGGVGSWAAEALARSGVGALTLVDMDHIAESNINRQVHALDGTLGQAKVLAMQDRIAQINPACRVAVVEDFVTPENWLSLAPPQADAVIDACDQIKAKTSMAAWALKTRRTFISVGAAGGKRLAHRVDVDDLSQTTHDPLLAQLRYRLRKEHGAPRDGKKLGVTCVFSREPVQPADASCAMPDTASTSAQSDSTLNCHGYGSVVSVTATFGLCAAGWILEKISAGALKAPSK